MLFDWMKSVIFYLLFSGICVQISPSDKYRRYIRWFIGLVVIVLLMNPIRFLFRFGSGDLEEILTEIGYSQAETETTTGGDIYDYYDMGLRASLKQELSVYGAEEVSLITDTDGTLRQCTVYVGSAEATENREQEIKNYISDVYNLDASHTYVISR